MDELQRFTCSSSLPNSPSGEPSLVVQFKVPSTYLSTLRTTSTVPREPIFDAVPFTAPVANMTTRTYLGDPAPSTFSQNLKPWPDCYGRKLLTAVSAKSLPWFAQREDICCDGVRKVVENSHNLVLEKGGSMPPPRAVNESLEVLKHPGKPSAKSFTHSSQAMGTSRAISREHVKAVIKPEADAKPFSQSLSANLHSLTPMCNEIRSSKKVPETDRILRSRSMTEVSSKPELNTSHRAKIEAEIKTSAKATDDHEFRREMDTGSGIDARRQREPKMPAGEGRVAGEKKRKGWIRKIASADGDGEMVASWTRARVVLETG